MTTLPISRKSLGAKPTPHFSRLLSIRQSVSASVNLYQDFLRAEAADRTADKGHDGVIQIAGHQNLSQPLLYLGFGGNYRLVAHPEFDDRGGEV